MVSNHGVMARGAKIAILAKYFNVCNKIIKCLSLFLDSLVECVTFKSLVNYASVKFSQLFNYGGDIIAVDVEELVDLLGFLRESVS